jgi:hypothetical protein
MDEVISTKEDSHVMHAFSNREAKDVASHTRGWVYGCKVWVAVEERRDDRRLIEPCVRCLSVWDDDPIESCCRVERPAELRARDPITLAATIRSERSADP